MHLGPNFVGSEIVCRFSVPVTVSFKELLSQELKMILLMERNIESNTLTMTKKDLLQKSHFIFTPLWNEAYVIFYANELRHM